MARPSVLPENVKRLNLVYPPEVLNQIEILQQETGATSITEVIRKAISLYLFITEKRKGGSKLTITNPDGTVERIEFL